MVGVEAFEEVLCCWNGRREDCRAGSVGGRRRQHCTWFQGGSEMVINASGDELV